MCFAVGFSNILNVILHFFLLFLYFIPPALALHSTCALLLHSCPSHQNFRYLSKCVKVVKIMFTIIRILKFLRIPGDTDLLSRNLTE